MFERESQWLQRAVEADEPNTARKIFRRGKYRDRVGCGAQANIPENKFTIVRLEPLRKFQLLNVERVRFGLWSKPRVHCFAHCRATNADHSVAETNQLVAFSRGHGRPCSQNRPGGKSVLGAEERSAYAPSHGSALEIVARKCRAQIGPTRRPIEHDRSGSDREGQGLRSRRSHPRLPRRPQ